MGIKKLTALILICGLLLPLAACGNKQSKNADKTINYNLTAEPETLDPQIASDSPSLIAIGSIFEGLIRLDANGKPAPGVASSWEAGNDSTEFTFHLRRDAKWTDDDGTPVTAKDFVYAFRRALDPQTGSKTCSTMFCIKNARAVNEGKASADSLGVTAKDEYTLVVQLEYSYPDFPKLTANAVFMPCNEKFFTETAGRYGIDSKYVMGNGPFCIDGKYGWEHGKYLNLKRSGSYSGASKPLPSKVDFSIGNKSVDVSNPVAALQNGTIDAASLSAGQASQAKENGCTVVSFEDTTWGLCFNTQSGIMKNANVRKAFIQAFNREKVISHLPSNILQAESMVLPSAELSGKKYLSAYGGPYYIKQSDNAAALLAAGLKEAGADSVGSVTVLCPDGSNANLMLNEMIVSWNAAFNNYFNMEILDSSELISRVKSGDYQLAVAPVTKTGSNALSVLSQFASGYSGNPAGFKNTGYDALLEKAENSGGSEAIQAYASAEKYLSDNAVFYPLYYGKHFYAMASGVSGIIFNSTQSGIDFINAGKE